MNTWFAALEMPFLLVAIIFGFLIKSRQEQPDRAGDDIHRFGIPCYGYWPHHHDRQRIG